MSERIAEEKINQIRESTDIVEVVGEYVQLKKQGRNYFGLCPFHGENSPSFSVSPDKQIFHCFGCGAGGNVFSFLMDIEAYSFVEAAVKLAEKANIDLEIDLGNLNQAQHVSNDVKQMLDAHELLCKFYHHLLVNTKEGQHALEYLLERGFTMESIKKFQIGYSLNSWDFVTKFLVKRNFPTQVLVDSGLIIKRESDGSYFDRFRDRIMFPIFDNKGNTIAFSGRTLGDEQPKYLNSPETVIFNKSKILYNYHLAKANIRKGSHAILFEGFADVISADRAEVLNSVATMGTSLTDDQVNIFKKVAENVTICYDSDFAGIEAAFRAGKMLTKVGIHVKVAMVPNGLDPDDYIKQNGPERFRNEVINAPVTWMSFKMLYFRRGKNLQIEGDRLLYIEEIVKEIATLSSAVEIDHYLRQLSGEFSISYEALKQQLESVVNQQQPKQKKIEGKQQKEASPVVQARGLPKAYQTAERRLIAHMLRNMDITYKIKDLLNGSTFNVDEHQAIFTYLLGYYEEGNLPDSSSFLNYLKDDKLKRTVAEIDMMSIANEITPIELNDYLKQVFNYPKMLMIKEKKAERREAEKQNDHNRAAIIALEIINLEKAMK